MDRKGTDPVEQRDKQDLENSKIAMPSSVRRKTIYIFTALATKKVTKI